MNSELFLENPELIIPILAISTGIIISLAVFIWQYYDAKGKRETVLEISKHLDDTSKLEELLNIFDERKKEPIDYRRNGVITIFVGAGLFFLGYFFVGNVLSLEIHPECCLHMLLVVEAEAGLGQLLFH